jgi:hypothetical protein
VGKTVSRRRDRGFWDRAAQGAKTRDRGIGIRDSSGPEYLGDLLDYANGIAELWRQVDANSITEQIGAALDLDQSLSISLGDWTFSSGFQSISVYDPANHPGEISNPNDPNTVNTTASGPSSTPPNICVPGGAASPPSEIVINHRGRTQTLKVISKPKAPAPSEKRTPMGEGRHREGWDKPSVSWAGVDKGTIERQKEKTDPGRARVETMLA